MNQTQEFSMSHQLAPSVVATCMSSIGVVDAVEALYREQPELSVRFLCFWFNCFSSAVIPFLVILHMYR
jgi:hypothetical protein